MENRLLSRNEVPEELTWDLRLLYEKEELMYADLEKAETLANEIDQKFRGKLNTAENINACMTGYQKFIEYYTLVATYAELAVSIDYTDAAANERLGRVETKTALLRAQLSFVESEIIEQSEEVLRQAIAAGGANALYLKKLLKQKPHALHPEVEKTLAALSKVMNGPYEVYNISKLADMRFDNFAAGGKTYPLGYSLFEDSYEYTEDTEVRRGAFAAFSKKLKDYENITATAYNLQLQKEKSIAGLRGFDSVFDYLLFDQQVSRELYDRQIDLIMEKLAPHMQKYARLLAKVHRLDKMTYADLKLPVDPEYAPAVTIEGSKEYIEKGLAILGEDYVEMIRQAYRERWVDFARNAGKSTGGFCASPYGKNSFILLSWNDKMSDVFTLAHELGHAGHFKTCNAAQSILDTEVSSYFVEAPSTMNELLMGHYLLGTSDDKRFRRWVLSNIVSNTYYHNFVTHLLEAAYQREVYKLVDSGSGVQAGVLKEIMRSTLEKFWGDSVELTEGAELTWMRQPHYYLGLYSYTYSAGLTVATAVCERINKGESRAVEDWKKVLRAGGTLTPAELAALAGIDITTDGPLLQTIETIGGMIDEICKLTEELD